MSLDEIGELERGTGCCRRVTWRIPNFMSLPGKFNTFYSSPHFHFLNSHWFLRIYPHYFTSEEWIAFYLRRSSPGPPENARCRFSIRKADGMEEEKFQFKKGHIFSEEGKSKGTSKFLQRSELLLRKSELAPMDVLTVVCTLWSDVGNQTFISRETQTEDLVHGVAKEEILTQLDTKGQSLVSRGTQTEDLADGVAKEEFLTQLDTKGGAILRTHFQNLLLESKDQDVTLKVKDQEFRAHKNILRVRSPVFSAMFAHHMAENECGEVCIEDCEPNAFSEFLKYVYVGKFENMPPATAVILYYIADKYDFPDLKKTCVEFLKASLTTNVICDVVPLAMSHGEDELLECAMEFFSKHMIETFMTLEWQNFITRSPILANELNIKAMKISQKSSE